MNRLFTESEEAGIIELYRSGFDGHELSRQFKCSNRAIYSLLSRAGVEMRTKTETYILRSKNPAFPWDRFKGLEVGKEFGRWKVEGLPIFRKPKWFIPCICECGNRGLVENRSLKENRSRSCGCWTAERAREVHSVLRRKHGHACKRVAGRDTQSIELGCS